jgi:DNA modification methylase
MQTIIITVINADVLKALRSLPDGCVQTVITSPPYLWLRNYGIKGQIGLEKSPQEYIQLLVDVFREIWRVLRDDGTVWLNMGDSYAGSGKGPSESLNGKNISSHLASLEMGQNSNVPKGWKAGDLMGMPWRLVFALQDAGWYLRTDIIWAKGSCMPESIKTRPTRSHEFIFLLTKSGKPQFWVHPEKDGVRTKPEPDYLYTNKETGEQSRDPPNKDNRKIWKRRNLWVGFNYFYDAQAIKEPVSESYQKDRRLPGVLRQRQNKKSKYPNKGQHERKQDLTGNPTYTGFNDRYNVAMAREGSNVAGHSGNSMNNFSLTRNNRDVWHINTQARPEAHFASFPDKLPEICIKAGTSEYGCCPACGAPYARVLKKVASTMNIRVRDNKKGIIDQKSGLGEQYAASDDEIEEYGEERAGVTETVGWRSTCSCQAGDPVPCVTLDPFMGRGTVALVSRELGRSSIGIELNPEYCEITRLNLMGENAPKKKKCAKQKALDTGVVQYDFKVLS